MANLKRLGGIFLVGAAAAAVVGLSVAPAFAGVAKATWTIKPGGTTGANAGKTVLKDTNTGNSLSCSSSMATAVLKSGSGLSGSAAGKITAISFTNCIGPAGITFTVTPGHLPWHLNLVSFNSTTGVTTGSITGIHATLSGASCSAVVDGATSATSNNGKVKATYTNSTHQLKVSGGNLHLYNVSGCFGLINSGDATTFTGTYTLTVPQTITSP
ncbi:MAG TPA: hypothetical protein VGS19_17100 [Streptosporangiaceae bacterium]|nr:hypothetical protein [Streptosporangiaceae bacterium]